MCCGCIQSAVRQFCAPLCPGQQYRYRLLRGRYQGLRGPVATWGGAAQSGISVLFESPRAATRRSGGGAGLTRRQSRSDADYWDGSRRWVCEKNRDGRQPDKAIRVWWWRLYAWFELRVARWWSRVGLCACQAVSCCPFG